MVGAGTELPASESPPPRERMLDWKSAWPLWVAALLVIATVIWRGVWILDVRNWESGELPGRAVANSFDLSTAIVPVERIQNGNMALDALKPLNEPLILTREERKDLSYHLVALEDRVIGVALGGEARAYPLRILNWHEVANDTLAERPIAVTYSGLCDSAAVYLRTVGGEVLTFRISGLLLNSNLLFYDDHQTDADARSLWSQLTGRAISGPRAGVQLEAVPCALLTLGDWLAMHPDSTLVNGTTNPSNARAFRKLYGKDPHFTYYQAGVPRFSAIPEPPPGSGVPFSRVLIVTTPEGEFSFPFATIAANAAGTPHATWSAMAGKTRLTLRYREGPECAWVAAREGPVTAVRTSFWFAYYAARQTQFGGP
ncbi:MAG: DUF3179 domain-containing protein [Planctomycetes bacterium]|nr:DUF3179 domain-containing protein [Planctomycetota bacterium]